jgi:hypothetical protein
MSTNIQERPGVDPAACRTVLERVAASSSLKRAARLREFLLFVGNQSLKEGRNDIHEQEIGETVFARQRSYDTSQDNIVRVSATELRKRVDAYFAGEGSAEPLIFEIPRGSYLPTFRLRESVSPGVLPLAMAAPEPMHSREALLSRPPVLPWILSAVAVLLAIACILLWRQNSMLQQRLQILEHPSGISQNSTGLEFAYSVAPIRG